MKVREYLKERLERSMEKIQAEKIVDGIIEDFTDRRGLRQEWEQIDEETQQEIRDTWIKIVLSS